VATAQDRANRSGRARLLKAQHNREEPSRAERQESARQQREALQQAQGARRENLEVNASSFAGRHGEEREALAELQSARSAAIVQERAARQPKGVMAFLARITGFDALTAFRTPERTGGGTRNSGCRRPPHRRHRREMQNFRARRAASAALDKRERRSLETGLRREALKQIARQGRPTIQPEFTAAATGKTGNQKKATTSEKKS